METIVVAIVVGSVSLLTVQLKRHQNRRDENERRMRQSLPAFEALSEATLNLVHFMYHEISSSSPKGDEEMQRRDGVMKELNERLDAASEGVRGFEHDLPDDVLASIRLLRRPDRRLEPLQEVFEPLVSDLDRYIDQQRHGSARDDVAIWRRGWRVVARRRGRRRGGA